MGQSREICPKCKRKPRDLHKERCPRSRWSHERLDGKMRSLSGFRWIHHNNGQPYRRPS